MKENPATRSTFTLKKNIREILVKLAEKTGLKMSTIVERGILLFEKESK